MELMQLEMFVAMVEEGSFHKAAERVFRTQPALSMAIRKLEEEIGGPVFDRSNRTQYVLTDTGEALYDYARRLLSLRDEALTSLKELQSLQAGRIRIGANESTSLYLLPKLILAFREQCPNIKIEVFRQVSKKLPLELRQRNLDIALLSFKPDDRELEATPLMQDTLALIASPAHRLSSETSVRIGDLGVESFVAHNVHSPSREKVIGTFRDRGTPLNITIEIATIETIKKFVAMNLGLAFVPLMCVQEEVTRKELVVIPVEDFHHERSLWLVRRRGDGQSHAARAFIELASTLGNVLSTNCSADEKAVEAKDSLPAKEPSAEAIN